MDLGDTSGPVTLTISAEPALQACYFKGVGKQITLPSSGGARSLQIVCEDKQFFVAGESFPLSSAKSGTRKLYITDGTPEGTKALTAQVPDITASPHPISNYSLRLGNALFFKLGTEWERSDGTPGGTMPAAWGSATTADVSPHDGALYLLQTQADGSAIITAVYHPDDTPSLIAQLPDSTSQQYQYLYALDSGVLLIRENKTSGGAQSLIFVPYDSSATPPPPWPYFSSTAVGPVETGTSLFLGMGKNSAGVGTLFMSDGTENGTRYISLPIAQPEEPRFIGHVGHQQIFEIDDKTSGQPGLYALDQGNWSTLIADACAGKSSKPLSTRSLSGSRLTYSCAVTDSNGVIQGEDVWQVRDLNQSTTPIRLFSYDQAFDGAYYTVSRLIESHEIQATESCPLAPRSCQKNLIFSSVSLTSETSSGLQQIYSTTAEISMLGYMPYLYSLSAANRQPSIGPYLLFKSYDSAHGWEPWTTDGTAAGTRLLIDSNPGPNDGVASFF